ncbi:DUF5681 domain-containing protein [Novosphingobium sp.]|uniref:DUF5681 domain-containing protein n=1 Tax=Novosphingobium sp. TaxID=1874826 RepID=UPI001ED1FB5A|nr:DUF5681 domain-containing protein [Novosphingobium sp.]MBK9010167.1 hypothetical protein [Novosphingobium sp.]
MSDGTNDDKVGYGRPPRSGQFKSGQSGNPLGRPRKAKKANRSLPAIEPTRKLFREVASRPVMVREGERSFEIPITEAVIMALAKQAMQGGVLAQRTYLQYQLADDAIVAAAKRETFEYWRDYVRRKEVEIAKANAAGRQPPEPLPHPDDIRFDFATLGVRFVGPQNEQGVEKCRKEWREVLFLIEVMIHQGIHDPQAIFNPGPEVDIYALLFLILIAGIPRRFRVRSETHLAAMDARFCMTPARQRAALRELGEAVGFPIDPDQRLPKLDLRLANLRINEGALEQYVWPKVTSA